MHGPMYIKFFLLYQVLCICIYIDDRNSRDYTQRSTCLYIYLNINQLDALDFIMSLFHASTCFEHTCLSSAGQIVLYSLWYHHTETSEWSKITKITKILVILLKYLKF